LRGLTSKWQPVCLAFKLFCNSYEEWGHYQQIDENFNL